MKHLYIMLLLAILAGCANNSNEMSGWRTVNFTDVRNSETFSIEDFEGQYVLMESFAVWCPTCKEQQNEIRKLHDSVEFVSISLDTDPNEDAEIVKNYLQENDFDWRFAVSPPNATQMLIDEFGVGVVNAPRAPVVLVCPNQSARLMEGGLKDTEELSLEIEKGCQ